MECCSLTIMKSSVLIIFLLVCLTSVANGYKFLVIFHMPAPSHYILGSALARGLAEAGHDVTMISPFGEKDPPKNGKYRDVVLTGYIEQFVRMSDNFFDMEDANIYLAQFFFNLISTVSTENFFNNTNVQEFLNSNEQFDAVIMEQFMNDAFKVLAHHFKAPLILFSTVGANAWVNNLVANPAPYSYIPNVFMSYSSNMTFYERLQNTLFSLFAEINSRLLYLPKQKEIMKKYFPDAPDLSVLNYNASLLLLNSHTSINQPVPNVPCMVNIGGYHVKPPKKLPKDLQEFLDNAKEGVIYFSMGSNLKSKELPEEKRNAILKTFSKLKEKVLWKWENDTLPGKPKNLMTSPWLPQQDILAHPNVKIFITHGGLLSTTETIYHGVPVITIPIFGDQKINAATAERNGYGINVPFKKLSEQTLTEAINKILTNPKYQENAKTRSKIMHDRPVKPMDEAIYWIEYVVRHKGAPHLRVEGLNLPLYQYLTLDVWAFLIAVTIASNAVLFVIVRRVCCRRRLSTSRVNDSKKKN